MKYWLIQVRQGGSSFTTAEPVSDLLCQAGDEPLRDEQVFEAIYNLKITSSVRPRYVVRPLDRLPDDYLAHDADWVGAGLEMWVVKRR